MQTDKAIEHAGSPKALADLLGITPSAVSQWGDEVPQAREWQLRVIRPEWFIESHPAPRTAKKQPRAARA